MDYRLRKHPILDDKESSQVSFLFKGQELTAKEGEIISSALFANGIHILGHHPKDQAPQGIFCANGQCSQCLVLADGIPVKSCVTPVRPGMRVEPLSDLPELPEDNKAATVGDFVPIKTKVLIIGGGPAGLMAALELGKQGLDIILADDKHELGGKLSLQTHNFFGSIKDCFAGTRGMDIGINLAKEVEEISNIDIWLNAVAVGVFVDKKVGIVKDGKYCLVEPEIIVNATGARENPLAFPGCDLPGIYGAGAFQTLVNRDLVKPAEKLFVVGGGNVGLIASYHAIQAGIEVVGLVEALPKCGGYKVHADKLKRFGVPIYTSHTVLKAEGEGHLEKITISAIDDKFNPIPGTQREFEVDTLLLAVGLTPVNELAEKAKAFGFNIYNVGDSEEISEASAAIFSGKIIGRKILVDMGYDVEIPKEWPRLLEVLRQEPGEIKQYEFIPPDAKKYPVIRCIEKIPCNPCIEVCPLKSISIPNDEQGREDIMGYPEYNGKCVLCGKCVAICPGLAITLVDKDYDKQGEKAAVIIPWELPEGVITEGMEVVTSDFDGNTVGKAKVVEIKGAKWLDRRKLVKLEAPFDEVDRIAGIKIYNIEDIEGTDVDYTEGTDDNVILCRCERVTKGEIREYIRKGYRDINALKAVLRVGMGACGGKTCMPLIKRLFREEGVDLKEVTEHVERPFTQEVNLLSVIEGKEDK